MENEEETKDEVRKCPKCNVPLEEKMGVYGSVGKVCPVCDMREIDMDDEDELDWRERRR